MQINQYYQVYMVNVEFTKIMQIGTLLRFLQSEIAKRHEYFPMPTGLEFEQNQTKLQSSTMV